MILFVDCNGTLFNDVPIWHESVKEVFLAYGKKPPTRREYFQELATGDWMSVYRKNGFTQSRETLNGLFRPAYEARMGKVRPAVGSKKALLRLKKRGVYLVLLTAQIEELIAPLVDKFSLRPIFDECFFHGVDKKAFIQKVMREQGARPEDCFMVGDTPYDVHHAKQAGITAIGFLNQANSETSLRMAGADQCIRRFKDLENILC